MDIQVSVETVDVFRFLRRVFRDQIPFATSKAINDTAKDFQRAEREHMHDIFTVRRRTFIDRSVKIKPFATKHRLSATVSIDPPGGQRRADILTKFEAGGTKRPRGRHIAVPDEARRTRSGVISRTQRPRALQFELWGRGPEATVFRGTRRAFMVVPHQRGGAIFQRRAKRRVVQLFAFTSKARIPAVLEFEETAERVVNERFGVRFSEAFDRAVRTAR